MSLIDRLSDITRCDLNTYDAFVVNGIRVGSIVPTFTKQLQQFPEVFEIKDNTVSVSPSLTSPEHRTEAVAQCLKELRQQGVVHGWREELYPVSTGFQASPLFLIERAAATLFGIRIYAVNLSGYVQNENGLSLWIARRSMTKQTSPGKLDTMVSGGQPAGVTVRDNLIKECAEEANLPAHLAQRAISTGGISFCTERPEGVLMYFQFNFDLEIPVDFVPENTDGEVDSFQLWTAEQLRECVANTREFSYDSALVAIDFMIRHGVIESDDPEYTDLVLGLRTGFYTDPMHTNRES